MTILIVEDEEKTAGYLRKGLQEAGYLVQVAATGDQGRRLIEGNRYDLVVLDVMLPGVEVVLEKQEDGRWTLLNSAVTNEQGRIPALFPDGRAWSAGTYKVTFRTGKWFAERKADSFFPEIPVIFKADGRQPHYHIPLLLSPYGFSTYRGN